jgi:hypothetical protein
MGEGRRQRLTLYKVFDGIAGTVPPGLLKPLTVLI